MTNIIIILLILFMGYMVLIMPAITKKKEMKELTQWHYAHRGFHDNKTDAPENSLKSFELAVAHKYGVELDTQLTKDNVVVVFHDETLDRICGVASKVRDYTYEELSAFKLLDSHETIPTFSSVLEIISGKIPMVVEIKMYTGSTLVCELTDKLLHDYSGDYCVESFHPQAVLWYKKNRPQIVRGQLSCKMTGKKDFQPQQLLVQTLVTNIATKPDFIAYCHDDKKSVSRSICKSIFHNTPVAWTIRSQAEMDACKKDFEIFIFEGFEPK